MLIGPMRAVRCIWLARQSATPVAEGRGRKPLRITVRSSNTCLPRLPYSQRNSNSGVSEH